MILASGLSVTEGAIKINSVHRVIDHDDVKIWSIDCLSKYAAPVLSWGDGAAELLLVATEETLHVDEPKRGVPTTLSYTYPSGENWMLLADGGRYEFYLVAYRLLRDEEILK